MMRGDDRCGAVANRCLSLSFTFECEIIVDRRRVEWKVSCGVYCEWYCTSDRSKVDGRLAP